MSFREADFEALQAAWTAFYPSRYAIDADQLRLNTAESPVFDWGASRIVPCQEGVHGFAAVKKSANPSLFSGVDADQAHLSAIAFCDPNVGVDLFAEVKRTLRNRGVAQIVFGQDSRHFFPGCPIDCPNLRSFLTVQGFVEGDSDIVDLERDISNYEPKANCLAPLGDWPGCKAPNDSKPSVRALRPEERPLLEEFLQREFPGRWTYDTLHKIDVEGKADFVYGLFINGRIEGFASTQDFSHSLPVNGCVWRLDLGEHWGGLGPIGISAAIRGRGLGDAILGGALLGLQAKGVHRMIIDWTGLVDYYGGHGFEVARRYRSNVLSLT